MKQYHIAVNREGTFINLNKPRDTRHTYFVHRSAEIYLYFIGRDAPPINELLEIQSAVVAWIEGATVFH